MPGKQLFPQASVTLNTMKQLRFACLHAAVPPLNLTLKGEFDFLRIKPKGQAGSGESRTSLPVVYKVKK